MGFKRTFSSALGVLSIALVLVGCHTMTGRTAGRYIDDQTLTTEVKTKLVADRLANLTRVNVTTQNGVVYLTGTVDTPDRAQRAADLANSVSGVRQVVNQIQVASTTPPSVASTPSSASPTVTTLPPTATATSTASNGAGAQAPVDVTGTVAHYDPQTGIVTLQDGRMVRIAPTASVWQAQRAGDIQPGQQLYLRNAVPVGMQPSGAQASTGNWRLATVSRVDTAANMLYLTDGTALQVQPTTRLTVNGQPIALSQVQPGAQVAVLTGGTSSTAPTPSALPRSTAGTPSSSPIVIFNAPATR